MVENQHRNWVMKGHTTENIGGSIQRAEEFEEDIPGYVTPKAVQKMCEDKAKEFDEQVKAGKLTSYSIHHEQVIVYHKEWRGKRPMPEAKDDSLVWEKPGGDLFKGDILKFRVANPDMDTYGQWVYAVCSGSGNGCHGGAMGNAIFVGWVGYDAKEVIGHRNDENTPENRVERWERYWDLYVLADRAKPKA